MNYYKTFTAKWKLKEWIFDTWEKNYRISINDNDFDAEHHKLAYDWENEKFEIYSNEDKNLKKVLMAFCLKDIDTVDDIEIIIEEEIEEIETNELAKIDYEKVIKIIAKNGELLTG